MLESHASNSRRRTILPFPELSINEIVECMSDIGFPLSDTALTKPTSIQTIRLLEFCSSFFMSVSRESFGNIPFPVLSQLEYPEMYFEALCLFKLYAISSRLMKIVHVPDFSLRDVLKPDGGRLRTILSGIINYAKFREEQLYVYEENMQKVEAVASEVAALNEKIVRMQERLEEYKLGEPSVEEKKQELGNQEAGLMDEIKSLRKQQLGINEELQEAKIKLNEAADKKANDSYTAIMLKKELEVLEEALLIPPENLIQTLKTLEDENAVSLDSLNRIEADNHHLLQQTDFGRVIEQSISNIGSKARECMNLLKKSEQIERENTDARKDIKSVRTSIQDFEYEVQKSQQSLELLKKKVLGLNDEKEKLIQKETVTRDEFNRRYEEALKEVSDIKNYCNSKLEEAQRYRQLSSTHIREFDNEVGEIISLVSAARNLFLLFLGEIGRKVRGINSEIDEITFEHL